MLTFFAGSGSPYTWKVWLALEHKGIPYELRMLSFQAGDLRKPEFRAMNPRGKVPTVLDGDYAIYESAAIVEYLEDAYRGTGPSLWPTELRARATARRIATETYLQEAVEGIYEQTFFLDAGAAPDLDALARHKETAAAEIALIPDGWLAGGAPSAADYAMYPPLAQLGRLQKKFPQHGTGALLEPVRGYMARVEALPYFDKTYPPHWRG
jgi:glutathione S-transferase